MKAAVVTNSWADFSKLEPLLTGLEQDEYFEPFLIVSGSHLTVESGFTVENIRKKHQICSCIYSLVSGDTYPSMAQSVALGITQVSSTLANIMPDFVVVHGDRFDAFAAASAASLSHHFVVHIEGGELSGTIDGSLRHAITKLANAHFVCNQVARRRLLLMGENSSCIATTGCPSYDRFREYQDQASAIDNNVLREYALSSNKYVLAILHPDTQSPEWSVQDFESMLQFLISINDPVLLFYPNVDPLNKSMIQKLHLYQKHYPDSFRRINIFTRIENPSFVALLNNAACIVGNSSVNVREACFFGVPSLTIGNRQDGRQSGHNILDLGHADADSIRKAYEGVCGERFSPEHVYGDGHAVKRMLQEFRKMDFCNTSKRFRDPAE